MARVPLDIVTRRVDGNAREGVRMYVYERGTTTPVTGYTTEGGGTTVSYPLLSNAEGRYPAAWYGPGSYDLYSPDDATNPTQPWEAVLGVDSTDVADALAAAEAATAAVEALEAVAATTAELEAAIAAVKIGREFLTPTGVAATDTAALQAALDAEPNKIELGGEGSGTPFLINAQLTLREGNTIEGCGPAVTWIKAANGLNTDVMKTASYGSGIVGLTLRDFAIDGNKANNSSGSGILADVQGSNFDNIVVKNAATDGFNIDTSGSDTVISTWGRRAIMMRECYSYGAGRYGIYSEAHDLEAISCYAVQSATVNLYMNSVGVVIGGHFWNLTADASGADYAIRVASDVTIVNAIAEGASSAQVYVGGNNLRWFGGSVFDGSGFPNVPGFEFAASAYSHDIQSVYIHDTGTAGAFKFTGTAESSKLGAHIYDPGGGPAGVGSPHANVVFNLTLGGSTGLGTVPGRRTAPYGGMVFPESQSAASAPANSVYRDSADGEQKIKDQFGTTREIY